MDDENWSLFGLSLGWIISIGVGLLIVALIWTAASRTLYDMQTEAIHHSIGYIESRNSHARDMIVVYRASVDDGQRKATHNDICAAANDLTPNEVARDVRAFLSTYPCGGG